ncbi:MAG: glutamine synthetase [Candidatus Thorarchaeota archaeon]|nr:MAG: glutamine synthetase [Candidatus Thorarchaeota archaeon]
MNKQNLEVLERVEHEEISFIDLMFSDLYGQLKCVTISPRELADCLEYGKWFDGSSVEGFTRIHESDMLLLPDPTTYIKLPWPRHGKNAARIICDVHEPEKVPFKGAPRNILKRIYKKAEKKGWSYQVGPEIEFFLLGSKTEVDYHDRASYFDFSPMDLGTDIRAVMVSTLEGLGVEVEMTHHECGPSQHEIDIGYTDAVKSADNILVAKQAIKTVASSRGLHATFMPKPKSGVAGSGMHIHQSLFNGDGENLFHDDRDPYQLSTLAYHFMGGQLEHIREMAAILCPTVNSYKRLGGFEAPVHVCWGQRNRSALIRVPKYGKNRQESARLELRCPDPSCNPYIAFAVMLAAGLRGIEKKIEPPEPVEEDVFDFDDAKLAEFYIKSMPSDLGEAIAELEQSKFMKATLGEHAFEKYLGLRNAEWADYKRSVTDWEREHYMDL